MPKIIIKEYSNQPVGSTIGAHLYSYGINYNGNYSYSLTTTKESMGYLVESLKKGNEVEYIKAEQNS